MNQFNQGAFLDSSLALAANVLGQATMVVVVAAILAVIFRRGAAARHVVWLCALGGVLLSPALALVVASADLAVVTIPSHPLSTLSTPDWEGSIRPIVDPPEEHAEGPIYTAGQSPSPGLTTASSPEIADHSRARRREHRHRLAATSAFYIAWNGISSFWSWRLAAVLLLLTWALGVSVLLVRLSQGHLVSRRLRRTARPIDQGDWSDLLSRVAETLGLRREQLPSITTLPALGEPVTAGVLRPMILTPEGLLQTLTPQQLHDVLVHECAHVIRRDPLVGLLQRLAELLFWPHPLIHFMNRRLSQAREEVCDNYVLRAGDPIGYSRTLVAVAESCHARQPASPFVTHLITPRWTLEARVAGLLDARRIPMTTVHRGTLTTIAAVLLTTGLAVAGVRLGEPAGGPQQKGPAAAPQARPRRRPEQTRIIGLVVDEPGRQVPRTVVRVLSQEETFTTSGPDGSFTLVLDQPVLRHGLLHASADDGARQGLVELSGTLNQPETTVKVVLRDAKLVTVRVIDKQGAAIPNASIVVLVEYTSSPTGLVIPLLSSQTDAHGLAHLRVPTDARTSNVVALKPGFGLDYYEADRVVARLGKRELLPLPEKITLVLSGARTAKVRAIDSAGRPIPDIEFLLSGIHLSGKLEMVRVAMSPVFPLKTDAQGVATFDFLPASFQRVFFQLRRSEEFVVESIPPPIVSSAELERETTFRLLRKVSISGRVIGADGQPAAGILLQVDGRPLRGRAFVQTGESARTGADGTFRLEDRPDMSLMITVVDDRWATVTKTGIVTRLGQPVEGIELGLVPGTLVRGRATAGPNHRPMVDQMVELIETVGPLVNDVRAPGQPRVGNAPAQMQRRTMTDSDGRYQFRVGPGEYLIALRDVTQRLGPIKVGNEPEVVRDFDIDQPSVLQLTGVVVQKAPDDHPVANAVVDGCSYGTTGGRSNFHAIADARGKFATERYADPMMILARSPDEKLAGLAFITADDENVRVAISASATVHGRIIYQDGKPLAENSVFCRIVMDPPDQAEVKQPQPGVIRFRPEPPVIVRTIMTDAQGHYRFAAIPVGSRCQLYSYPVIGETQQVGRTNVAVKNPGPIAAPDLVLTPQAPRNPERARQAPGKAE